MKQNSVGITDVVCRNLERSRAFLYRALALAVGQPRLGGMSCQGANLCLGGRAGIFTF